MINSQNDISDLESHNKIYIPSNVLNQNYSYYISDDHITIITNSNCYQQYTSTYCDCRYYNYKNNVLSETYTCNTNNNNPRIGYSNLTSDINFSSFLTGQWFIGKSSILITFVVAILFAIFLTKERSSY